MGVGSSQVFNPPNGTPIATIPGSWEAAIIHPNGNIYVSTRTTLMTYDPITNTTTSIGNFPPGIEIYHFYLVGGTLYGFGYAGPGTSPIYEINLTNPSISIQITPFVSSPVSSSTTASNGQTIVSWIGGGATPQMDFALFNTNTFTYTTLCQTPLSLVEGLSPLPIGTAIPACVCLPSSAGTPIVASANLCITNAYIASFNNDFQLDPDDGIGFILYTDLANPIASTFFQNSTGIFPFVPPLVAGVTYYVSRVVGDLSGGQVLLSDPCLDISPHVSVIWRALPQVISLTSSGNNLCSGQCENVTLQVSGTPPFAIDWQLQQGGNVVTPTAFLGGQSSSTITFQACAPANGITGPVNLVICGLVDAFCVNQP